MIDLTLVKECKARIKSYSNYSQVEYIGFTIAVELFTPHLDGDVSNEIEEAEGSQFTEAMIIHEVDICVALDEQFRETFDDNWETQMDEFNERAVLFAGRLKRLTNKCEGLKLRLNEMIDDLRHSEINESS